jgi:hypothetical protein
MKSSLLGLILKSLLATANLSQLKARCHLLEPVIVVPVRRVVSEIEVIYKLETAAMTFFLSTILYPEVASFSM